MIELQDIGLARDQGCPTMGKKGRNYFFEFSIQEN